MQIEKKCTEKMVFLCTRFLRMLRSWEFRQKVSEFFLDRSAKESGRTDAISARNYKFQTKKHRFYTDFGTIMPTAISEAPGGVGQVGGVQG